MNRVEQSRVVRVEYGSLRMTVSTYSSTDTLFFELLLSCMCCGYLSSLGNLNTEYSEEFGQKYGIRYVEAVCRVDYLELVL